MGKEVRIYTSFSDASDGCCRVRSLVPLFINLCVFVSSLECCDKNVTPRFCRSFYRRGSCKKYPFELAIDIHVN